MGGSGGGGRGGARPAWQPSGSTASYTEQQVRDLESVRPATVLRTQVNDVFLCHAWPDRQAAANDVYELLLGENVSVWFSEVSLRPGTAEEPMEDIVVKIAELVGIVTEEEADELRMKSAAN